MSAEQLRLCLVWGRHHLQEIGLLINALGRIVWNHHQVTDNLVLSGFYDIYPSYLCQAGKSELGSMSGLIGRAGIKGPGV